MLRRQNRREFLTDAVGAAAICAIGGCVTRGDAVGCAYPLPGGFAFRLYTLTSQDESMRIVGIRDFLCC